MSERPISRGFTLIELLVVIAIIGILSSIVIASLNTARAKGNDAKRKGDLHNVAEAMDAYFEDNSFLPGNSSGWCASFNADDPYGFDGSSMPAPKLAPTYIPTIPSDPSRATAGRGGNYIFIINDNTGGHFTLGALMQQDPGNGQTCVCSGITYNYCISQ